jgi:hypothetical protein
MPHNPVSTFPGKGHFALHWYTQMRTGQIDRTQLTAAYSAQLTDDAVRA